jgi:hypothetical protein
MKSLIVLLQSILYDLGDWCGISTSQDIKTILARIDHEGLSFLTITLSDYGRDFQKSLAQGRIDSDSFVGFAKRGEFPNFLGGFLSLVFDRNTNELLDFPSVDAIFAIRQITLMWAKINLECTEKRNVKAIQKYLECEQDIRSADTLVSNEDRESFLDLADCFTQGYSLESTIWFIRETSFQSTGLVLRPTVLEVILNTTNGSGLGGWRITFLTESLSWPRGVRLTHTPTVLAVEFPLITRPLISWIPVKNGLLR